MIDVVVVGAAVVATYPLGEPLVTGVVGAVATLLYDGRMDGDGQTWGKRFAHVHVVDEATGEPIGRARGLRRAALPAIGHLLGAVIPPLALLRIVDPVAALLDARRRALHDRVAGSIVAVGDPPARTGADHARSPLR